jgi:hypothetical protein
MGKFTKDRRVTKDFLYSKNVYKTILTIIIILSHSIFIFIGYLLQKGQS